jgi:sec-independent protein translocase protein TatA
MGIFSAHPEIWVLLLIAFLFFGAKRLPEAGSSIGKAIREFQKSMREGDQPSQQAAVTPPAQPQQLAAASPSAPGATTTVTPATTESTTEHSTTPVQ